MNYNYTFPCVKGKQAKNDFYICMIPCKLLSKLFPVQSDDVLPEFRAQRRLNEKRIPEIKDYILNNRHSYVFSALAASIDGCFSFKSTDGDVGVLVVPMESRFLINDGQHRNAAIQEALKEDPTLGEETIPVVFFEDKGLARSQQMFTDLNKYAVKPSKSQNTFYDHKDELAILTKDIVNSVPFLRDYTDVENDTLGKYSAKIFTLNSFYVANQYVVGKNALTLEIKDFCKEYWLILSSSIDEWQRLMCKDIAKKTLREDYIITQNIVLYAFGKLGNYLYDNNLNDLRKILSKLKDINWLRTNPDWSGVAIENGKISAKKNNISLTYIKIKELVGVALEEKERLMLKETK